MKFNEIDLSQDILKAVEELGYSEMTEIQLQSIPLLLQGKDVVGRSSTGTGKTAAFGIPAVESITNADKFFPAVLILCPTRELAVQACDEIKKFAKYKRIVKVCAVYGGANMEKQISELKRGVNIVIGTPGRIMDHIRRSTLKLDTIRTVILDEADEMLNMGFREDIETILAYVPEKRQTVLFSATMPPDILAITEKYQHNPVHVKIKSSQKTVDLIEQYWFKVAMGKKTDALKLLLAAYSPDSAIVFCNTKKMVDELTEELSKSGIRVASLHGDMKQAQRMQVMNSFKAKNTTVLIATDVAARGIDVSGINAVFNYDLPQNNEYYIHRIGRTGRAGMKGAAYSLITNHRQQYELNNIARYINAEITELPLPTKDDIISAKMTAIINETVALSTPDTNAYEIIERLEAQCINCHEIAARLISDRLNKEISSLPEINISNPRKRKDESSSDTVRIDLNIGKTKRIGPNFILGALVDATGMSGENFGKIDIYDNHTTVEIPKTEYDYILDMTNSLKINGHKVEVKLYKGNSSKENPRNYKERSHDGRKNKPGRRKSAYGKRRKSNVFDDNTRDRRKRAKKRH